MSIFSKIDSDSLLRENISEEITEMLESISNTEAIINSYMVESSVIINEASILDTVKSIIQKIIKFIVSLYEKFTSLFMTQTQYINHMIQRHSDKLNSLSDYDLKDIVYEYRNFNISKNIPVFGYFSNVQKYIDKLSSFKLTFAEIDDYKYLFSEELSLIRGKIIGKDDRISEHDFIGQIRSVFRGSNDIFMKHLTKADLNKIIDGVQSYKTTKSIVEADKDKLLQECNKYIIVISNIMNIKYGDDAYGGTLTNDKGEKRDVDIITVNKYKTYQNLVVSFISQIAETYAIVYKEKLSAMKDRYEMEISVLSQIAQLV